MELFLEKLLDAVLEMLKSGTVDLIGSLVISTAISITYVVTYPFYMSALYNLSKRKKRNGSWVAFIPIINNFVVGNILGEITIFNKKIKNLGFVLLGLTILSLSPIPFVGKIASIILTLLYWVSIHRIYEIYKPDRADLFMILGIVSKCLTPLLLFSIRNAPETHSKLIIDDNNDGIYDREVITLDNNSNKECDINTYITRE